MGSGLAGLEGLNGLGQDQEGLVPSSDIEANIRKLENTQAKINAALEAFRSVKAGDNSPVMDFQSGNPAASMSRDRPLTVKNFEKQSSRTAPAKMRQNSFSTKSSDSSGNFLKIVMIICLLKLYFSLKTGQFQHHSFFALFSQVLLNKNMNPLQNITKFSLNILNFGLKFI